MVLFWMGFNYDYVVCVCSGCEWCCYGFGIDVFYEGCDG